MSLLRGFCLTSFLFTVLPEGPHWILNGCDVGYLLCWSVFVFDMWIGDGLICCLQGHGCVFSLVFITPCPCLI